MVGVLGTFRRRTLPTLGWAPARPLTWAGAVAAAGRSTATTAASAAGRGTAVLGCSTGVPLTRLPEVFDLLGGQALAGPAGLGQSPGRVRWDVHLLVEVLGGGVGLGRLGDAEVEGLVDHGPAVQVVPVDEGDGHAGVARTSGAADAMQVRL